MGLALVIGNKNYSSWSLRPWLLLKQAGIPFREIRISLYTEESPVQIRKYSPSGKVPALLDDGVTVWESLAICEYLADKFPERQLWPADRIARAEARSVATEMHAGFGALRQHMSMNCRRHLPGKGRTPEVLRDIARITVLWNDCRVRFGDNGQFLFGKFSIADCMYAPVALRFVTYDVELDPVSAAYVKTIAALPAIRQWVADARAEPEVIPQFEPYA
ncbi:MAG TPA: glutathione S-transferase family protein [Candidatus Methylomirabilis sp.]|nr:glutathione S-transferase family protein [Candidatus Methylomirabilis sp.]